MVCVCRPLTGIYGSSVQEKESCFGRCTADVAMQLGHLWSRLLATRKLQDHPWTPCASYGMDYPLGMCCSPLYASSCGRSWSCVRRCGVHCAHPCTFWSSLSRRCNHRSRTEDEDLRLQALAHLVFSIQLCRQQMRHQRWFSLEHPPSAASWNLDLLQDLLASGSSLLASGSSQIGTMVVAGNDMLKVRKYVFDSCRWGHRDPGNGKLFRKGNVLRAMLICHLFACVVCAVCGTRWSRVTSMLARSRGLAVHAWQGNTHGHSVSSGPR